MIKNVKDLVQKMESHIDADRLSAAYAYNVRVDSPEIALRGLQDKNINIQRAWAARDDYPVTPEIMDTLVFSKDHKLREQACKKNHVLSSEQLEHLLQDKNVEVIASLLKRKDIEIPKEYIEKGLQSETQELRESYERYVQRIHESKCGESQEYIYEL